MVTGLLVFQLKDSVLIAIARYVQSSRYRGLRYVCEEGFGRETGKTGKIRARRLSVDYPVCVRLKADELPVKGMPRKQFPGLELRLLFFETFRNPLRYAVR